MWRRVFSAFVVAAIAAELVGIVTILVATFERETVGLGALVPVYFLLPSALWYLLASNVRPLKAWATPGFWLPVLGLIVLSPAMWLGGGEGSGLAFYVVLVLFFAACAAFAALQRISPAR